MNKCYLSFYMPKVLAISPFSNVYVFKLIITHKTEKKKKKRFLEAVGKSEHSNITFT